MKTHPAFEKAKPERRWTGKLPELWEVLRREAWQIGATATPVMRQADGDFSWRILPGGAVVGMRMRDDLGALRREIRLCRNEPLEKPEKWALEVGTFLRLFGLRELDGTTPADERGVCWVRVPSDGPRDAGKTVARFVELLPGEITPEAARCHRCHLAGRLVVVEYRPGDAIAGQHCIEHAEFSLDDRERAKAGAR